MLIHQGADTDGPALIDLLDRVLDRGIVIDAWLRVSLTGLEVVTVEARIVVASIETFLEHAQPLTRAAPLSSSAGGASRPRGRAVVPFRTGRVS
jgi:hypothetical protein